MIYVLLLFMNCCNMSNEKKRINLIATKNQIATECDSISECLQAIKRKAEEAINFYSELNRIDSLKKYPAIYEYLNKLHVKLLDQSCQFELFFEDLLLASETELFCSITTNRSNRISVCSDYTLDNFISETCRAQSVISYQNLPITNNINIKSEFTAENFPQGLCNLESQENCVNSENVNKVELNEFNTIKDIIKTKSKKIENTRTIRLDSEGIEQVNKQLNKQVVEQSVEQATKQSVEQPVEQAIEQSVEQAIEQSIEQVIEKSVEQAIEQSVEQSLSQISDDSDDSDMEKSPKIIEVNAEIYASNECDEKKQEVGDVLCLKNAISHSIGRIESRKSQSSVSIPNLKPTIKKPITKIAKVDEVVVEKKAPVVKVPVQTKKTYNNVKCEAKANVIDVKRGPIPKENDICFVSVAHSPSEFYIQLICEDNVLIDYLSEQIAEVVHNLKSFHSKVDAIKTIKKYCICYVDEDACWYRAAVIHWMLESDNSVVVQLIDYGYKLTVPLQNIREAVSHFFEIPVMAEKCQLAWVKHPTNENGWPRESIAFFREMVDPSANSLFTVSYAKYVEDKNILIVDLEKDNVSSVAGAMLLADKALQNLEEGEEKQFSQYMNQQILKSQGFAKDEAENFCDDDDEEITDPNIAVSHYSAKDESRICRFFLARGSCFKGKNCRFSHAPLNPDGWTTDREEVYIDVFNKYAFPPAGSKITVKVISIIDLCSFYVVIKNLRSTADVIEQPVNTLRGLVALMNDPKEVKTYRKLYVIPVYSQLILVKYENLWQRGRVLDTDEYVDKVILHVFLIDLGITTEANMKDTRYIEKKHLHLPVQVVKCILSNAVLKVNMTDDENDMGGDYLELNVLRKKLEAEVVYSAGFLSVLLYTETGENVGQNLIMAGIVKECKEDIFPSPRFQILVD